MLLNRPKTTAGGTESAFEVDKMEQKYDLSEYVDRLYSAAVKKTRDTGIAEDIAQETLLAALLQLKRGKQPENLWAWLLTILSHKYCDWLREKYNRPQISFETYPFEIAEETVPDDDSEEKLEVIRRELGYLARIHREVLVRFYMHGHTLERISRDLQIPVGTVKSRLNIGREHIRKGAAIMENYTKQSYEPDTLHIAFSGRAGVSGEPVSLVADSDRLAQSILIQCYAKPLTEAELSRSLGVPAAFVEPVVERLTAGELMGRTEGGKVYTDFIIYRDKDRKATFEKQLAVVEQFFPLFWEETERGLAELREKPFYVRQNACARTRLELYFSVKLLMNAHIIVRDEVTDPMPYSEYPYRKDGGRWIAMGMQYPSGYSREEDAYFWKYGVDGEAAFAGKNFRDAKYLKLHSYDTALGGRGLDYRNVPEYVKWFYELWEQVPPEASAIDAHVVQDADSLIEHGFLRRGETLELDIPVLNPGEYQDMCGLAAEYEKKTAASMGEVLGPVFEKGFVKLPAHLKSVPKWQQYMFCGDSVPMAVIYKAKEKKLFLDGVDYPLPASVFVCEKEIR